MQVTWGNLPSELKTVIYSGDTTMDNTFYSLLKSAIVERSYLATPGEQGLRKFKFEDELFLKFEYGPIITQLHSKSDPTEIPRYM